MEVTQVPHYLELNRKVHMGWVMGIYKVIKEHHRVIKVANNTEEFDKMKHSGETHLAMVSSLLDPSWIGELNGLGLHPRGSRMLDMVMIVKLVWPW